MARDQRLRKSQEFAIVLKRGKRWSNDLLVLGAYPNDLGVNRYGFSVGKRVGKAVRRNLVKRRLRETVRGLSTKKGWDMVFIARSSASKVTYRALREALQGLLRSAGLLHQLVVYAS